MFLSLRAGHLATRCGKTTPRDTLVYLAGPMSGLDDFNRLAFRHAADTLRELDFRVESPVELDDADPWTGEDEGSLEAWSFFLRRDLAVLTECDAVAVLPGWEHSRGASLEVRVAATLGLPVVRAQDLTPVPAPDPLGPVAGSNQAAQVGQEGKSTNPKDALGSGRVPLHLFPSTAIVEGAMVMLTGALKYGAYNWREAGVRATIYVDAAMRHLVAFANGEDDDPESGRPHLAHALACLAIVLDADLCDKFIDDRPTGAPVYDRIQELIPEVARIKEAYSDKEQA